MLFRCCPRLCRNDRCTLLPQFRSRISYINTDKEYEENPLLKNLQIPANLTMEDFSLLAPKEGGDGVWA